MMSTLLPIDIQELRDAAVKGEKLLKLLEVLKSIPQVTTSNDPVSFSNWNTGEEYFEKHELRWLIQLGVIATQEKVERELMELKNRYYLNPEDE